MFSHGINFRDREIESRICATTNQDDCPESSVHIMQQLKTETDVYLSREPACRNGRGSGAIAKQSFRQWG